MSTAANDWGWSLDTVFGGSGQLAQELVRLASARGIALTAFTHAEVDIADSNRSSGRVCKAQAGPSINAAAYTKVDLAETEVEQARHGNEHRPRRTRRKPVPCDRCAALSIFQPIMSSTAQNASAYTESRSNSPNQRLRTDQSCWRGSDATSPPSPHHASHWLGLW